MSELQMEMEMPVLTPAQPSRFKKSFPNILSIFRVACAVAGFIAGFFSDGRDYIRWVFIGFFAASMIADAFDGFLARKWKVCSELGSRLDTLGDYATAAAAVIYCVFQLKLFSNLGRTNTIVAATLVGFLVALKAAGFVVTRIKPDASTLCTHGGLSLGPGLLCLWLFILSS